MYGLLSVDHLERGKVQKRSFMRHMFYHRPMLVANLAFVVETRISPVFKRKASVLY